MSRSHVACGLVVRIEPGFVGKRACRDAALHPSREESGQDLDQTQGVVDALVVAPVGSVDVLLDGLVVERAIGEAIAGEDVEPLLVEERAELGETITSQ